MGGRAIPVVAFCLWAAGFPVAGAPLRDPRFVRLSAEHGLSQDTVTCILQDHERFMWFGTEEGLNRYDGYSFKVFKHDPKDPTSLASSFIYVIYEDRAHRLWVGTTAGLSLFDRATETFRNSDAVGPVPSGVLTMLEDSRGRLWAGTNRTGLSRIDPATGHVSANYRHVTGDATSLTHDEVWKIVEDETGRFWIGTAEGLNLF